MEKLGIFWEDSELWNCWQLSTLFFPSVPITWLGEILSTPPPASTTQVLTHLHLPSTLIAIPPVLTSDSIHTVLISKRPILFLLTSKIFYGAKGGRHHFEGPEHTHWFSSTISQSGRHTEHKTFSKLSQLWKGMGGFEEFCDATASEDYPQSTNSDRPMGTNKEFAGQLRNNA